MTTRSVLLFAVATAVSMTVACNGARSDSEARRDTATSAGYTTSTADISATPWRVSIGLRANL